MLSPGSDAAQVQEGLASLLQRNCSFLFFFYYYFLSWTRRVKSDTLSRAGPQPLLLCNCCSGGTGPARSRPPPSFRAEGFFPHHPPPSGSGVCVCTDGLLPPPPPHSPSKEPGPRAFCTFQGGDTDPDLPVPSLFLLTGFFPTCTSGYCGTTGWGRVGGSPPPLSNPPGSSLCLSSCGKPGPQKCFMFL